MPRNVDGENTIQEQRWIELNSSSSLIQLIHSLQREQERFHKGFSQDRISQIEYRGSVIEFDEDEREGRELNIQVKYHRPETPEERVYNEEIERRQAELEEVRRRQEYFRMREEFDGIPIPEEEREPVVEAPVGRAGRRPLRFNWGAAAAPQREPRLIPQPGGPIPVVEGADVHWDEEQGNWVAVRNVNRDGVPE